jgi:hypothetical protein
VGVLFADLAIMGTDDRLLLRNRFVQGYGIGLRLKNEHLIFNFAQFSLAFYPNSFPIDTRSLQYYYTGHSYYRMQDFGFGQPNILGFTE